MRNERDLMEKKKRDEKIAMFFMVIGAILLVLMVGLMIYSKCSGRNDMDDIIDTLLCAIGFIVCVAAFFLPFRGGGIF